MTHLIGRRDLLRGAALMPLAGALAACANASSAVPQWMSAIQAIGQESALVMPQLQQAGLSGPTAAMAQTIIGNIERAATAVAGASSATQGQSALIQIEADVNALAPIALPVVGMLPGGSILGLIIVALPAIETMVNVTASLLSASAKQVAATAPKPAARPGAAMASYTPEEALAIIMRRTGG